MKSVPQQMFHHTGNSAIVQIIIKMKANNLNNFGQFTWVLLLCLTWELWQTIDSIIFIINWQVYILATGANVDMSVLFLEGNQKKHTLSLSFPVFPFFFFSIWHSFSFLLVLSSRIQKPPAMWVLQIYQTKSIGSRWRRGSSSPWWWWVSTKTKSEGGGCARSVIYVKEQYT